MHRLAFEAIARGISIGRSVREASSISERFTRRLDVVICEEIDDKEEKVDPVDLAIGISRSLLVAMVDVARFSGIEEKEILTAVRMEWRRKDAYKKNT